MPHKQPHNLSHEEIPMAPYRYNELDERLVGIPAVNPFFRAVSGPRAAMFNKHFSQRPPIEQPSSQRLQTGVGYEVGKYTYQLALPANAYIIDVIHKYTPSLTGPSGFINPLSSIIFEHADTQMIDVLHLDRFHSQHQYFGTERAYNANVMDQIYPNKRIGEKMVLADSPCKAPDGDYHFGIHANMGLYSHEVTIEDGILISESFAEKLNITLFETRSITFNNNTVGLNIYGNKDVYKIFPNIGEKIRDDGIVFTVREYDDELTPADMSYRSLCRPNLFDTSIYGHPGAEVIDVEVIRGDTSQSSRLSGMTEQLEFHHNSHVRYYKAIYDRYRALAKHYRSDLKLSHRFNSLVREAIAVLRSTENKLSYRGRDKLNGWTVKVTYKYKLTPKLAYKITDLMGGKGVICKVVPDEQMPVNEIGIRADIVMDNQSPYKRTIMGKPQEIYINASLDMTVHHIKNIVKKDDPSTYIKAFDYIMGWYKIVSPVLYQKILENNVNPTKHIEEILKGNIGLWVPANNPVNYMEVVELLEKYYPACLGKIKFADPNGNIVTSKTDILIGGCYVIMLDKIATDAAAVSSARTQHFGVPSKISKINKHHTPSRDQPTKSIAEDESRMLEAIIGGPKAAELLDLTNNPDVHKQVLARIYQTEKPSGIDTLIDRDEMPTGNGYIQTMVNNALMCAGIEFVPAEKGVD